jgi:hypothetical protein
MAVMVTLTGESLQFLLLFAGFQFVRALIAVIRARLTSQTPRTGMIELKLPRACEGLAAPMRKALCQSCAFAHIVQGYERGEEIVTCGFAFPPREMLFVVRACTDYKPKGERGGAGIAAEGG